MRHIVWISMPRGFDRSIVEASAPFPRADIMREIFQPLDMEIGGLEIGRVVPGNAVVLRRRANQQESSEKNHQRQKPAALYGFKRWIVHRPNLQRRQNFDLGSRLRSLAPNSKDGFTDGAKEKSIEHARGRHEEAVPHADLRLRGHRSE